MEKLDFGVIVICTKKDLLFAKGCCASIKHFMPDVPICLLMDGDFDLEGLDKVYNTFLLSRKNIKNDFLRSESFGWGTTRMIAFWESPFEHFLLIDSDVCVWGNLRQVADFQKYDIILDKPCTNYTDSDINHFFFDTEKFEGLNVGFDYKKHASDFVCPAVLMAKRGSISLEDYKKVLSLHNENPSVFHYGDMGFFNYMMFDLAEKGRFRLGQFPFQYLVPDFSNQNIKEKFPVSGISNEDLIPNVVHWCGNAKPIRKNKHGWDTQLMTFFRTKFYQDKKVWSFLIPINLELEDFKWYLSGQLDYYKRRFKSKFLK